MESPMELRNALERPMDPIAGACHGSVKLLFQKRLGTAEDDPALARFVADAFCHDIDATVGWLRGSSAARRLMLSLLTVHPSVGAATFDHHYCPFEAILEHIAPTYGRRKRSWVRQEQRR